MIYIVYSLKTGETGFATLEKAKVHVKYLSSIDEKMSICIIPSSDYQGKLG
jgi:hypothetical protein